jgi:hypothetical protein
MFDIILGITIAAFAIVAIRKFIEAVRPYNGDEE